VSVLTFSRASALVIAISLLTPLAGATAATASQPKLSVVAGESQYANVAAQIGGSFVHVTAILTNPNVDPHTFEASSQVAQEISNANVLVENGLGYDTFVNNIAQASSKSSRSVINVSTLVRLKDESSNPHIWYSPVTMPAFALALAQKLSKLLPSEKAYFNGNVKKFDTSLAPWTSEIALSVKEQSRKSVAVTEPVADYLLEAMGLKIATPQIFQSDVMNGVDPSPQGIALEQELLSNHTVGALIYNEQVVTSLTGSLRALARSHSVAVVGVFEIMPTRAQSYQDWMLSETSQILKAVNSAK